MTRKKLATAKVRYNGVTYTRNLRLCWQSLTRCWVDGVLDGGVEAVALAAGVSRSTVSRFLSGHVVSLPTTLRILTVLRLGFDEVHTLEPDLSIVPDSDTPHVKS
jgi:transcriptional regulator with XRE-family HTH domain